MQGPRLGLLHSIDANHKSVSADIHQVKWGVTNIHHKKTFKEPMSMKKKCKKRIHHQGH